MALSPDEEAKLKNLKENLAVLLHRSPEELIQEDRLGSELCFRTGGSSIPKGPISFFIIERSRFISSAFFYVDKYRQCHQGGHFCIL